MAIKKASSQTWVNKGTTSAAVSSQNMITTAPFSAGQIATVPTGFVIPVTANNAALGGSIYPYSPGVPTITTIVITDSNFTAIDDTALNTQGGFLVIQGVGFATGAIAYVQGVACISTTVMSSTEIRVQTPIVSSGILQVYIINPDNSVAFKVSGVLTSGRPNWITASGLDEQMDNLSFSIVLTANSDSTIAYSLQAGSSIPANTTLTSTGTFSGTISQLATPTIFSFTVVATDLELQDTPRTFNVSVIIGDPQFPQVQVLLKTEANTWITDTSNNRFNANVTGGAISSSFSPFISDGITGSAYFDGTGDYIEWANNDAFGMASGDFTIEGWVYYIGGAFANNKYFIDFHPATTGALYPSISANATGNIIFKTDMTSNLIIGNAVTTNAWHHIAVSRFNGDTRLFLDGVVQGIRVADANNYLPGPVRVGRNNDGTAENAFNGYMSNLRITKNVSYYQSNTTFTPSTTTLTRDTANTSLLTLQFRTSENGLRAVDTSAANSNTRPSVVTLGGNATLSPYSPVGVSGWSTFFVNQTLSFLEPPIVVQNANTGIVNTFTIEAWVKPKYVFAGNAFYIFYSDAGFYLYFQYDTQPAGYRNLFFQWNKYVGTSRKNAQMGITAASLVPMGKWSHIALVCNQNVFKIYINGIDYTSGASYNEDGTSFSITGNNNLNLYHSAAGNPATFGTSMGHVGGGSGQFQVSDMRTSYRAVYDQNFTPAQRPYGSPDRTSMYAFNNAYGKDINTQQPNPKIGSFELYSVPDGPYLQNVSMTPASVGGSVQLDGTGDFIAITTYNVSPTSANTNLSVRDQDFCFEFWFNDTYSSSPNSRNLVDTRGTGRGGGQFLFQHASASRVLQLYMSTNGTSFDVVNGLSLGQVSCNKWIHAAVYRIGNTIFASCNGNVSVANTGIGTASLHPLQQDMTLGVSSQDKTTVPMFGYFGPTRLVIGDSVYAANVCPIPTRAFERTANTKLLLNFDTNGVYDIAGGKVSLEQRGGLRARNTITKYANNSIFFNRVDAFLIQKYHTFQGGANEWQGSPINYAEYTFECWVYRLGINAQQTIFDFRTTEPQANPLLFIDTSNILNYWVSGSARIASATNAVPANTWTHVAVSRSATTGTKMFINGVQSGVVYSDPTTIYGGIKMFIGAAHGSSELFGGYMEDIRHTVGVARYTTNTAAPTRAFSMR